ncbi:hypothetical protein V6N13_084613 [Hibiscus sabdariffa]
MHVISLLHKVTLVKCQPALDADLCGLVPFLLGLAALVLLVLAQVSGNCFAGCICTKKDFDKESATKQLAAASHIFSWFLVCSLIMALDTTAGILSITVQTTDEGSREDDVAHGIVAFLLGFVASLLLVLAQVSGNCFAGCIWICTKEDLDKASGKKKMAVASHIFSWIMLAVGLTMLIVGMAKFESASDHVFFVGGLVCFIHGLFTVAYIVSAIAAAREDLASGIQNPLERYLRS